MVITYHFWQRARQPNGTVTTQRAQLQDFACALHARQDVQKHALIGCNLDLGKSGSGALAQCMIERRVGGDEAIAQVSINSSPCLWIHKLSTFISLQFCP
jgi:hypothetical protein